MEAIDISLNVNAVLAGKSSRDKEILKAREARRGFTRHWETRKHASHEYFVIVPRQTRSSFAAGFQFLTSEPDLYTLAEERACQVDSQLLIIHEDGSRDEGNSESLLSAAESQLVAP